MKRLGKTENWSLGEDGKWRYKSGNSPAHLAKEHVCPTCGESFISWKNKSSNGGPLFCSRACVPIAGPKYGRPRKEFFNPNPIDPAIKVSGDPKRWSLFDDGQYRYLSGDQWSLGDWFTCASCGEQFIGQKHSRHERRFCSRRCLGAGVGPKGKITPEGYRRTEKTGYVVVRITDENGYSRSIFEHRLVMQNHLGRPLARSEFVHHKNGDRSDNAIDNLEIWHRGHPPGQRVTEGKPHCATCTCFDH